MQALVSGLAGHTRDDIPTARVRSVGVFHCIGRDVSPDRPGESLRAGPAVVKETILEFEHTKSVSMPSTLLADAGTDVGRFAFAGSVKLRLTLVAGACSGCCCDEAGVDMMRMLRSHCSCADMADECLLSTISPISCLFPASGACEWY